MQLDLVGQVGGPANAVAVDGKYMFVGQGMRMIVLDASKPSRMKQIGSTEPMEGFVNGIVVSKDKAFVAVGGEGIYTIDVRNPKKPKIIGRHDTLGYPEEVCVVGKYVYVADGWDGLVVVDVSDPKKPVEVGAITTLGYVFDVVVMKNVAYLAAAGAGLKVVDVKDPRNPVEIGSYNTSGYAYGLDYYQTHKKVYIADGWEGVVVVDVSNPQKPAFEKIFKTPGWAFDVKVRKGILYVADAFKGLRILNISSPSSPKEIGSVEFEGHTHAGRLAVSKDTVFIADNNSGLRAIDISNKKKPRQTAFVDFLDYASGITVLGKYACVAARRGGMHIVDISNPAHPKEKGLFKTKGNVFSIMSDQRYVYAGTGNKLYVLDISNPRKSKEIGSYDKEIARDMVIRNGVLYIANEWGLVLIDMSNQSNPKKLGSIELCNLFVREEFNATSGIALNGNYAYLVAGMGGIIIVDVSNPKNLKVVGHYKNIDFVHIIRVSGGYAYTVGTGGLTILDLSNPVKPAKIGEFYLPIGPEDVSIDGDIAFVSVGGSGLVMVDISNPEIPVHAGSYNTFGYTQSQYIGKESVYLADQDGGLVVLDKSVLSNVDKDNKYLYASRVIDTKYNHVQSKKLGSAYTNTPHPRNYRKRSSVGYRSISRNKIEGTAKKNYRSSNILVVTNPANRGPGTLRECIETANTGDTITFDSTVFPPDKPTTITLNSRIKSIEQGNITIDASNAGVILDGKRIQEDSVVWGICIASDGNVIRGLQILNFSGVGLSVEGNDNVIGGDRNKGKGPVGQGNVLSANRDFGLEISGNNNSAQGNIIGLDSSGKRKLGNGWSGASIYCGINNRLGGAVTSKGNIISANGWNGISVGGELCEGNLIEGNFIGTDISGSRLLENKIHGISFETGGSLIINNTIRNNVVAGYGAVINIHDQGTSYNSIIGNFIGTDCTGTKLLKSGCSSILIGGGANFNRVGGTHPSKKNIICVEGSLGFGSQTVGNLVMGNYIGLDVTGTLPFESLWEGLTIGSGTRSLFVGGLTEGEGNSFGIFDMSAVSSSSDNNVWIAGNSFGESVSSEALYHENSVALIISVAAEQNVIQGNSFDFHRPIYVIGDNNILVENSIKKANIGIEIDGSNNLIFHNNFLNNVTQAWDKGRNTWDWNGRGNYWSDYDGIDVNGDGIGDTPYYIPSNGVDHCPLMQLFFLP